MRIIKDATLFTPPGESPNHWAERFRVKLLKIVLGLSRGQAIRSASMERTVDE